MAEERAQRRLAAILAADVAGYSRLMGSDEEGTLAQLKAHRRDLFDPKIAEHRGRIVKTTGDGMLVEFLSVVDAVRCAIEVQRGMAECNAVVPEGTRIEFRIGVNLGDIIIDSDDIHGDGVNIAARLEGIAEPGGICISESSYQQVRDKLDIRFEDIGDQRLKNIARPVHVYRAHLGGAPATERQTLALTDKPSIAVLPFQNMSGDSEQDYFADGITEDVITTLARFRWFFVVARNSTFTYKGRAIDVKQVARELGVRYVLEGSVRKAGGRVRITAQLIDASTGNHIWAERYDREINDIFAVQDEITERVVGAIEPELLKVEGERGAARGAENISAWDLVRRGMWHFHQVTHPTHLKARELFREAVRLDPQLPEGHLWLARANAGLVPYGWSDNPAADLREGMAAALTAVQLDEKNPYSHYALAITSLFAGALDQSVRAAEKAIEISPTFALGYFVLGTTRLFSGKATEAIEPLEHGLRLSTYDPQNFVWLGMAALAFHFTTQPDRALNAALEALKIRPAWQPTVEIVALCYAVLDRADEARRMLTEMRTLEKSKTDLLARLKKHNPRWAESMAATLQKVRVSD